MEELEKCFTFFDDCLSFKAKFKDFEKVCKNIDLDKIDKAINSDNRYVQDKQSVWSVTSGAAWCMSFNRRVNKLAIGTEEGKSSVKIY